MEHLLERLFVEEEDRTPPASLQPIPPENPTDTWKYAHAAYLLELSAHHPWPKLDGTEEMSLELLLTGAVEILNRLSTDGPPVELLEQTGQDPERLMVNLWLALLNRGHAVHLERADRSCKLIVRRH
jgi:hypothetical protein